MKLPIKIPKRAEKTFPGVHALSVLINFDKKKVSTKEIIKKFEHAMNGEIDPYAIYLLDLASIAQEFNVKTIVQSIDLRFFNPGMEKLKQKTIKEKISEIKNNAYGPSKRHLEKILKYLHKGDFSIKLPRLETISSFLKNKKPVIITALSGVIEHKCNDNGKYFVIYGEDKKNFYVFDPLKGEIKIEKEKLLFAWSVVSISSTAHLLTIK